MKKVYQTPSMTVMEMKAASFLCGSGEKQVRSISGETVGFGGAGDGGSTGGSPRSRGFSGWDDEEEDDF